MTKKQQTALLRLVERLREVQEETCTKLGDLAEDLRGLTSRRPSVLRSKHGEEEARPTP